MKKIICLIIICKTSFISFGQKFKKIEYDIFRVENERKINVIKKKYKYYRFGLIKKIYDQTNDLENNFIADRIIEYKYPSKDSSVILEYQFIKLDKKSDYFLWRNRQILTHQNINSIVVDYGPWKIEKEIRKGGDYSVFSLQDRGNDPIAQIDSFSIQEKYCDNPTLSRKMIIKELKDESNYIKGEFYYEPFEDCLMLRTAFLSSLNEEIKCDYHPEGLIPVFEKKIEQGKENEINFLRNNTLGSISKYEYIYNKKGDWIEKRRIRTNGSNGLKYKNPKVNRITTRRIKYFIF